MVKLFCHTTYNICGLGSWLSFWLELHLNTDIEQKEDDSFSKLVWFQQLIIRRQQSCILVSLCLSVHPSVCRQSSMCFVSSTTLAGSISYLHILSTNFSRCVTYWRFEKFQNFNFCWKFLLLTYHLYLHDLSLITIFLILSNPIILSMSLPCELEPNFIQGLKDGLKYSQICA